MQILSAYLLTQEALEAGASERLFLAAREKIIGWIDSKDPVRTDELHGTFISRTGGAAGTYRLVEKTALIGRAMAVALKEPTKNGDAFTTEITIAQNENHVEVFCRLRVENRDTLIRPTNVDARCPAAIREIIEMSGEWSFGKERIPQSTRHLVSGSIDAASLVSHIISPDRELPIVVVSTVEGFPIWQGIAEDLSHDLAGLVHVYQIDDEAAWELTEKLGKMYSCYRGAIRLYWPRGNSGANHSALRGRVWTAAQLLSTDTDGGERNRFRAELRRLVFSGAVLAIDEPELANEIWECVEQDRFRELEARLDSKAEELEVLRLYFEENKELREELRRAKSDASELKSELAQIQFRLEAAEYALSARSVVSGGEPATNDEDESEPKPGEVRFYKKTHSTPNHDVMVRVNDCQHNKWQSANAAHKAKKGIERLERRDAWANIQHCGVCTGGGLYRVKW